jgi:hypothetical protein
VPLVIWVVIRIVRAFAATFRLLLDFRILRALPWPYIRTLPRRNRWIGFAAATLAVSLTASLVGAVLPQPASQVCTTLGIGTAAVGVLSSWARLLNR